MKHFLLSVVLIAICQNSWSASDSSLKPLIQPSAQMSELTAIELAVNEHAKRFNVGQFVARLYDRDGSVYVPQFDIDSMVYINSGNCRYSYFINPNREAEFKSQRCD